MPLKTISQKMPWLRLLTYTRTLQLGQGRKLIRKFWGEGAEY